MAADPTKWQVNGSGHSSQFVSKTSRDKANKHWMPETLGPGTYAGHSDYKHQPASAPFHARTPRFRPRPRGVAESEDAVAARGPGRYVVHEDWKVQPNHAPFLQREERGKLKHSGSTPTTLGPGTYRGHDEYGTTQSASNHVGFLTKQDRMKVPTRTIGETEDHLRARGPGVYRGHDAWDSQANHAPFNQKSRRGSAEKSSSSPNLGPGSYVAHSDYETQKNAVPFNCRQERMKPPARTIGETYEHVNARGPGTYKGHDNWDCQANHAPFLAKQPRSPAAATNTTDKLGPGTYVSHGSYDIKQGVSGFGAKTDRFATPGKLKANEDLGPGSYVGHKSY